MYENIEFNQVSTFNNDRFTTVVYEGIDQQGNTIGLFRTIDTITNTFAENYIAASSQNGISPQNPVILDNPKQDPNYQ